MSGYKRRSVMRDRHITRRAFFAGVSGVGAVVAGCRRDPAIDARISALLSTSLHSIDPGQTLVTYNDTSISDFVGFTSAVWSPDGRRIAVGGLGKPVSIWDATTGDLLLSLPTKESGWLDWSPDGAYLVSGGGDYARNESATVQVWHAHSGDQVMKYYGHKSHVNAVAWSPSGYLVASAGNDQTVQVWHALTGECLLTYKGHNTLVSKIAWSPDGRYIISCVDDLVGGVENPTVRVWNSRTGRDVFTYSGRANAIAWSPDGQLIAFGDSRGWVTMREALSGDMASSYQAGSAAVLAVAWSPNARSLVAAGGSTQSYSEDGFAHVRLLVTGDTFSYQGHKLAVLAAAWSPNGEQIVTTSYDKTAKVWQAV